MITEVANDMSCDPILKDQVRALQSAMETMPQVKLELKHYFANDVYARELIIPKDVTIVGKIHKYDHLVMIIKGELSFSTDDNSISRVKAPFIVHSKAGAKRAIYAHEDSVMVTVHKYNGEIEKADECLVFDKESDWLEFCKQEPMLALE